MSEATLSLEESQRYDRQIRIWGAEAQHRIQKAKVLVCGLRGITVELVKNIVLAGVNVTVQDHRLVEFYDLSHNFFLSHDSVGQKIAESSKDRIQELNNYAKIDVVNEKISSLPDEFFASFDLIIYAYFDKNEAVRLNTLGRMKSPQTVFFWAQSFAEDGLFYSDFGDIFEYKPDQPTNNNNNSSTNASSAAISLKTARFSPINAVLEKPWNSLTSRFHPLSPTYVKSRLLTHFYESHGRLPTSSDHQNICTLHEQLLSTNNVSSVIDAEAVETLTNSCEYTTILVCSILGGILSQEVIKAITRTGMPAFNVTVYSTATYIVKSFPVVVRDTDGVFWFGYDSFGLKDEKICFT